MYDFDELHGAHAAFWAALAQRLTALGIVDVPPLLTPDTSEHSVWKHPALLFGQACEYPLTQSFVGAMRIIASPCYDAQGCEGSFYRSAIVVRASDAARDLPDLRGKRCVINDWESNSGMNLLRHAVAPLARDGRFFGAVLVSGAHCESMRSVATGAADLAAIDCVTLALMRRIDPALSEQLRVLAWTSASPSLPYVTSVDTPREVIESLRWALADVLKDPALAAVREQLLLLGADLAPEEQLSHVRRYADEARERGYGMLA